MVKINPREIAVQALLEIMEEDAYNSVTLKKLLKQNGAMPPRDRAFVTEIVNGTLRNIYYIDYVLNQISTVKTEKMKPWILALLRMSVYQLLFLDKVPVSAVCNEAVELTKGKGFGKLSNFVNGVLRNVIRKEEEIQLPSEEENPVEYLTVRYSHPTWLLKMWLHQYDYDFVKDLCEKNNQAPRVTIACNTTKTTREALQKELEQEGVRVAKGRWNDNALLLSKTADMGKLDAFQKGYFHVQDESSLLAVAVLDPQKGEKILDVCAAPGGKSFSIGEKMENNGTVVSRDIFPHKVFLMEEGAKRLGLSIVQAQEWDATVFKEEDREQYDRVLIDAPCSGLGLIRKKPDIRLKKNGNAIDELEKIQREILKQGSQYVKGGGVLVYSTCTLCPKENLKNIQWFLKENPQYRLEDISSLLPQDMVFPTAKEGYVNLFPHIHETDGFFVARMRREQEDGKN